MTFKIYDLVSGKWLATITEGKGAADRKFVELQNQYPTRRLNMKMVSDAKGAK